MQSKDQSGFAGVSPRLCYTIIMVRKMVVVAALLLTGLTGIATAAENSEHRSKNAQKVLAVLNSLGMTDPDVKNFVAEVDSKVDDGYLNFTRNEVAGGELTLRYHLD